MIWIFWIVEAWLIPENAITITLDCLVTSLDHGWKKFDLVNILSKTFWEKTNSNTCVGNQMSLFWKQNRTKTKQKRSKT